MKSLGPFGLLHTFQTRQLRDANSVPSPSSPLEQFLSKFFIDFGSRKSQNIRDRVEKVDEDEGELKEFKESVTEQNDLVTTEEGIRTRLGF